MSGSYNNPGQGAGFFGALLLLFVALKLTGVIHWSWIWVLAPFWAPILLMLIILPIVYLMGNAGEGL
jgi:hypothetical protein